MITDSPSRTNTSQSQSWRAWRRAPEEIEPQWRVISSPQASTARTPEACSRSAASQATYGSSSLTVFSIIIDFVAGLLGAKKVGASRHAVIGAALGTLVGIFFGIPGLLLGPFVGALLGELVAGGTLRKATGVGVGTWLGFLFGTVVKIGLCFAMLGIFAFAFLV